VKNNRQENMQIQNAISARGVNNLARSDARKDKEKLIEATPNSTLGIKAGQKYNPIKRYHSKCYDPVDIFRNSVPASYPLALGILVREIECNQKMKHEAAVSREIG
jgi:hypothetical protein